MTTNEQMPFSTLVRGEKFRFLNDPADALCVKAGSHTYYVISSDDALAVGLTCDIVNRQTMVRKVPA